MDENKSKYKIGERIFIITKNGDIVIGILNSVTSYMSESEKEKCMFGITVGTSGVYLKLDDILVATHDNIFENAEDDKEILKEIGEKLDVKLFDEEGEILPCTSILDEMINNNKWDEMAEDTKNEFVKLINITSDDVVAIINVLCDLKNENSKLSRSWNWNPPHMMNRRSCFGKYGLFY